MTPSAKLINTLYNYIASEKPGFLHKADTDELVLLSHSLGGFIAFKTLAGEAAGPAVVCALQGSRECIAYVPACNHAQWQASDCTARYWALTP